MDRVWRGSGGGRGVFGWRWCGESRAAAGLICGSREAAGSADWLGWFCGYGEGVVAMVSGAFVGRLGGWECAERG